MSRLTKHDRDFIETYVESRDRYRALREIESIERGERYPGESIDDRAEAWLRAQHTDGWYIGDASLDDWEAAYAAVTAEG